MMIVSIFSLIGLVGCIGFIALLLVGGKVSITVNNPFHFRKMREEGIPNPMNALLSKKNKGN